MRLDPNTKVANLLKAMPSCATAFEKLGIGISQVESESLQQACMEHGVRLEEFLRAMDEIDWSDESFRAKREEPPITETPSA